jgi:uncharacterized membrane protein
MRDTELKKVPNGQNPSPVAFSDTLSLWERGATATRLPGLDAARGIAVLAMVVYHFSWDLAYFGYIAADVGADPGWKLFARAIAGSFIFIVGVSLALATRNGLNPPRYVRRIAVIAGAAAAVTIATRIIFPDAFIFFGILHLIAVASVLGLAFVWAPLPIVVVAAILSFLAPSLLAGPAFDHPALVWLGLSTSDPRTNDFVPVFPWFGVVLAGIAAARPAPHLGPAAAWLNDVRWPQPLLWAGRHSLGIYLLHQPLLFGLVYLAAHFAPPDLLGFEPAYIESCTASCMESDMEADACRAICGCMADRAQAEGLWTDFVRQTLTQEQAERYLGIVERCQTSDN